MICLRRERSEKARLALNLRLCYNSPETEKQSERDCGERGRVMTIDNRFLIKKFESFENIFVLFSQATKLPFVECDEETFDDQVYVFTDEAQTKEFAKKYTKEKILLLAVKIPQPQIKAFLSGLYAIGVNALVVQDEGAPVRVELEQLSPKPDLEALKSQPIPKLNPELQLTALYFLQELRRPMERTAADRKQLRTLEEEMAVNLMKSRFIIAVDVTDVEGEWDPKDKNQKVKIPFVKNKDGSIFQPCYSDMGEFQKFNAKNKNNKYRIIAAPYDELQKYLIRDAKGFVFNPAGFNLVLTREQMEQMKKNYA